MGAGSIATVNDEVCMHSHTADFACHAIAYALILVLSLYVFRRLMKMRRCSRRRLMEILVHVVAYGLLLCATLIAYWYNPKHIPGPVHQMIRAANLTTVVT